MKLKKALNKIFDIPEDVILEIPKLTIVGNHNILLENYKGIVEYDDCKIRVKVNIGTIVFEGQNMIIEEINDEDLIIRGEVKCLYLNYGTI